MRDSEQPAPKVKRKRFLLDRPSQMTVAKRLVGVLAAIGLLYAVAVCVLLDSDAVLASSLAETRLLLLAVHAGYFLVGGAILLITTLLLTHRFTGPAYVLEAAVKKMRVGAYDARLSTRQGDFHKTLTAELRHLRDELGEREAVRADLLTRLQRCLDETDVAGARKLVDRLRTGPTASTARAAEAAASDVAASDVAASDVAA